MVRQDRSAPRNGSGGVGEGWTGEAPGRLDFLGGVADYSGSLVLQMPIRATTRVEIGGIPEQQIRIESEQEGEITLPLEALHPLAETGCPEDGLRAALAERQVPHWACYPLGCFLLFCQARQWWPQSGLSFRISSDVPASMGVSSSAALEVAALRALEQASGRELSGTALAHLAQRAENRIVGAPCGLMDQLASAYGVPGALLPILCRPDTLFEPVRLPAGAVAVGWPSGVKHAVSASPYATARAGAFMGKKILETLLGRKVDHVSELPPSVVRGINAAALPHSLRGEAFLARYGGVDDPLSRIEPEAVYPVRAAVRFPVEENFRAETAALLLRGVNGETEEEILRGIGELLFQSHAGYSAMGLGCPETDAMVEAVRGLGRARGFYGARVSGGGSGGTVVVLLRRDALPELETLSRRLYFSESGPLPLIE